jgi:hypothetical protein
MPASIAESPLLNGFFDAAPDNTALTAAGYIGTTWRWNDLGTGGAGSLTRTAHTALQTDVPGSPAYFMRWAQTTGGTVTNPTVLAVVEDASTFQGELATVSGWYRSNTAIDVRIRQSFGTGGSPSSDVSTSVQTLPHTIATAGGSAAWLPFSVTFRLASTVAKTFGTTAATSFLAIEFRGPLSTVFQTDISSVRLDRGGSRGTSPRRPAQMELQMLRRYYGSYAVVGTGAVVPLAFSVQMRATPTVAGSAGTVTQGNATADACTFNHTATTALTVTADARLGS